MLILATAFWGLSFPAVKALALVLAGMQPGSGNWFVTAATVGPRFVLGALVLLVVEFFLARRHARANTLVGRAKPLAEPLVIMPASTIAAQPEASPYLKNLRAYARTTSGEWKQGIGIGIFAAGGMILQNDGLQFTEASTSAFLTQLTAILIPVFAALRARKNPGWRVWVCCVLVLAGVAILGHFDWRALRLGRGEIETLLATFFFAGQILVLDSAAFAGNRFMRITLIMFATEAVIYVIMALFTAPALPALFTPWASGGFIVLTLLLTVFCTLGAFLLMNAWQPKITATEAGVIYCMEPIFGSLLALVLPGMFSLAFAIGYANETITWTLLVGGALITGANILLQLKPPARPKAAEGRQNGEAVAA